MRSNSAFIFFPLPSRLLLTKALAPDAGHGVNTSQLRPAERVSKHSRLRRGTLCRRFPHDREEAGVLPPLFFLSRASLYRAPPLPMSSVMTRADRSSSILSESVHVQAKGGAA